MSERIYRFDRFELNTGESELRSNGSHIRLQEKPLRLLLTLLENPQQMVQDRAFAWLDKGYREGAVLVELKVDPRWDSLRDDARFADLMKRMGFVS